MFYDKLQCAVSAPEGHDADGDNAMAYRVTINEVADVRRADMVWSIDLIGAPYLALGGSHAAGILQDPIGASPLHDRCLLVLQHNNKVQTRHCLASDRVGVGQDQGTGWELVTQHNRSRILSCDELHMHSMFIWPNCRLFGRGGHCTVAMSLMAKTHT